MTAELAHLLLTIPGDNGPGYYPLEKISPGVNTPVECSNIRKAKIWKLALNCTPGPIWCNPRGGVLTLTDPQGLLPLGNFLWG